MMTVCVPYYWTLSSSDALEVLNRLLSYGESPLQSIITVEAQTLATDLQSENGNGLTPRRPGKWSNDECNPGAGPGGIDVRTNHDCAARNIVSTRHIHRVFRRHDWQQGGAR
jgi:hypothetical protein